MHKYSNGQLLEISEALTEMQQLKRLPSKMVYFVAKNLRQVNQSLEAYHLAKNALMEQIGTPDPAIPGRFSFTMESGKKFIAADKATLNLVQELDLARISFSDIELFQAACASSTPPADGISAKMLAGIWPLLDGEPSA